MAITPSDAQRIVLLVSPSNEDGGSYKSVKDTITFKSLHQIAQGRNPDKHYACWLIFTSAAKKTAEFLKRNFSTPDSSIFLKEINDIYSTLSIFDHIIEVASNPLNANQSVICDCTGGTKTMSVAMVITCTHYNLTSESTTCLILTYVAPDVRDDSFAFHEFDLSKVVAEEQRRYIEQQQRIGRLQYLARLSPILAHEIKNPLNRINGFLYRLRSNFTDEESKTLIENSEKTVEEISGIIDGVRQAVREERDSYIPSKIYLTEIVRRLKVRMGKKFPNLKMEINGDVTGSYLNIAEEKLYTIFTNLIDNAAYATKERGTVRLNFSSTENHMVASVEDNGPGIPLELRHNLFKAMHKGKNPSGTGMGLYIVRAFVIEEGGTIAYDESYRQGARFLIELPFERN